MSDSNALCICGEKTLRNFFSTNFDILKCETCSSQRFVARNMAHRADFNYDSSDMKYGDEHYLQTGELRWSHVELLKMQWAGRKVLEIGCFNGFFIAKLLERGAQAYGQDVNPKALQVGGDVFGLSGRLFETLDRVRDFAPFDDIICIDVMEHTDSPDQFFSVLSDMLAPNGRFFVAGPTIERRFHDKSDFPPHHKWWFSRPGLRAFFERHLFAVEMVMIQYDGMLFIRNLFGRLLHGIRHKEFYGDTRVITPRVEGPVMNAAYATASVIGQALFRFLRISYCSTILVGRKAAAPTVRSSQTI